MSPADRRQAVAPPGVQDLWDLPPVSCPKSSDVRPLFLPRTHGRSQPQCPSDLAHVEPTARPQTELPQQNQADILAIQVAGRDGCDRECGDRNCDDRLRWEAGLCLTRVILCRVEWNLQELRAGRKRWWSGICVPTRKAWDVFSCTTKPIRVLIQAGRFDLLGKWVGQGRTCLRREAQRKRWLLTIRAHLCVVKVCWTRKKITRGPSFSPKHCGKT